MIEIITADEARKISEDIASEQCRSILEDIDARIRAAALEGELSIYYEGLLPAYVLQVLVENGYKTYETSYSNKTRIGW